MRHEPHHSRITSTIVSATASHGANAFSASRRPLRISSQSLACGRNISASRDRDNLPAGLSGREVNKSCHVPRLMRFVPHRILRADYIFSMRHIQAVLVVALLLCSSYSIPSYSSTTCSSWRSSGNWLPNDGSVFSTPEALCKHYFPAAKSKFFAEYPTATSYNYYGIVGPGTNNVGLPTYQCIAIDTCPLYDCHYAYPTQLTEFTVAENQENGSCTYQLIFSGSSPSDASQPPSFCPIGNPVNQATGNKYPLVMKPVTPHVVSY